MNEQEQEALMDAVYDRVELHDAVHDSYDWPGWVETTHDTFVYVLED